MTIPSIVDINISLKNNRRVVLLKPNDSSRTNVEYKLVGRFNNVLALTKVKMNNIELRICPCILAGKYRINDPVAFHVRGRRSSPRIAKFCASE